MSIIIYNFETYLPPNERNQDEISSWLAKIQSIITPELFDERLIQKFSVKKEKIAKRSFFNNDVGDFEFKNKDIFYKENQFSPRLGERSLFYQKTVDQIFEKFFADKTDPPEEILHVTCTGYTSPSAGQKIIPRNNWSEKTGITHLYHMGCYAAIPAIKVAKGMTDKNRIDVVHTEICANHFDIKAQTAEQTVVQTLFADGAIKYSLNPNYQDDQTTTGIKVITMKEVIIPESEDAMTWAFGDNNLEMTLHRTVPSLIKKSLKPYVEDLFKKSSMDFNKDKDNVIFAIHPGGPKIIDQIMELLELREEQVRFSKEVLQERGNMSSATLPHMWKKIIEDQNVVRGTKVFSVAFGPGLTIAGFIGEKR